MKFFLDISTFTLGGVSRYSQPFRVGGVEGEIGLQGLAKTTTVNLLALRRWPSCWRVSCHRRVDPNLLVRRSQDRRSRQSAAPTRLCHHARALHVSRAFPMRRVLNLALMKDDCTVGSLKHPWSSPKNFRFRRCRRSNLDQNLPSITKPVSDLTGDQ
jgi:hypothetical protein